MSDVSTGPSSEGPVTGEDPTTEPAADVADAADVVADSDDVAEPSELEIALLERDEWMDRAQRIAADFENYRRRLATQRADDIDRATGRLAESLLPVLDACEAAFLQHPAEIEPLFNLMLSELKKQGLESMNLHEQPFDPHLADAVLHEPGEGEPIVSEVLRSGYTWNGKVLRPAMVKVRG